MTILIVATLTAIVSFVAGAAYGRRAEQYLFAQIVTVNTDIQDVFNAVVSRVKHLL